MTKGVEKMRNLVLLLIVLLSFSMLFITACGNGNNNNDNNDITTPMGIEDLTPATAEWAIMFIGANVKTPYQIGAYWIGGANIPQVGDTAILQINGTEVPLQSYGPGIWYGSMDTTQGTDATVKFVYNGTTKVETTIKTVNLITGSSFPTTYNPAQSSSFSWTLPADNQHQLAGVSAYKSNYPTADDYSDEYIQEIGVDTRSYTVPANPLANVPAGASYSMGVSEVNYKILNMVALISINGAWSDEYLQTAKPDRMRNFARKVVETLSK
jgi:hypothetical protein